MEEVGEGQWHGSGEGRRCGGDAVGLCLCSVAPTPPPNNKVGVMVRVEEFDEDLSQNCAKLPRLAACSCVRIWEPQTQSTLQRLGEGGAGMSEAAPEIGAGGREVGLEARASPGLQPKSIGGRLSGCGGRWGT